MKRVKSIVLLTALAVSLIVLLQNTQTVETRFLFIKISMPNAVLLGLTLLIGMAIGMMITLTLSNKRKKPKD